MEIGGRLGALPDAPAGLGLTALRVVPSLAARTTTPMNKAALVDEVQRLLRNGTSKAAAERATDAVLAAVKRGLRRDKEVSLVGFGAFAVATRPARRGFNPHTKQPMKIPAMKTVRFRASAELRALK
jgi:DNA-binding protein HU-beta